VDDLLLKPRVDKSCSANQYNNAFVSPLLNAQKKGITSQIY